MVSVLSVLFCVSEHSVGLIVGWVPSICSTAASFPTPLFSITEAGKSDELRLGERKGKGEDLRTSGGLLRNRRRQHLPGKRRRSPCQAVPCAS